MRFTEKGLRAEFLRDGAWTHNVGQPLVLTYEPAGDDETDIAWAVKGRVRNLGKYNFCAHIKPLLVLVNKALHHNDGQGENFLEIANGKIEDTRYELGRCTVKPLIPDIQDIIDIQALRYK